jgi:tetratricopeptide (TPR) repeat protein
MEEEYREAIRIKPDYAQAHCNLGQALKQLGRFREALTELRRGHEIGARDPRWPNPSGRWVKECERLVELDAVSLAVTQGAAAPADAESAFWLAWVCQLTKRYSAAARLLAAAMNSDPRVVSDPRTSVRFTAAGCAAQAGCGNGADAETAAASLATAPPFQRARTDRRRARGGRGRRSGRAIPRLGRPPRRAA